MVSTSGLKSGFAVLFPCRSTRPILLRTRSSTWFITATVCTAIFTDIFLYAVVVPVFPFSLVEHIGIAEHDVQHWLSVLLAVYGAGLLVGAPICGFVADKTKYRKWPLLIGLVAVAGATLLLCLARTIPLLIFGRLLQGMSASVIWVVGLALLTDTVGSNGLAMAMGYVGVAYSLGTLVAPLLGGIVYDRCGYYAVFAMTFGVIAVDIILRLTMIEKKAARRWLTEEKRKNSANSGKAQRRDSERPQLVRVESGSSANSEPNALMTNPANGHVNIDLEKSALEQHQEVSNPSLAAETKRRLPAIVSLWTSRRMLAAFWGNLVMASLVTGLDTTLTLFVSRTFGWNSQAAGILFLSILLPSMCAPIVGSYVDKYGSRLIATAGFVISVPPCILLRFVDHDSLKQKVLLVTLLAIIGTGIALALPAQMAEFGKICDSKERSSPGIFGAGGAYAQSYGIFNMSWAAGSMIGAFWAGGVYSKAGWGTVGWSWGLLCAITAVPVLLFTDGWIGKGVEFAWWQRRRSSASEVDECRA